MSGRIREPQQLGKCVEWQGEWIERPDDASTVSKTNEMVGIGDGDSTGVKPGAGSARRGEDGHQNWSNVLSRHWDMPSTHNGMA